MHALDSLYPRLTKELEALLRDMPARQAEALEEIRIRRQQPVVLMIDGRSMVTDLTMDDGKMEELLAALSGFALYRFEHQMAEGYMPLPGGHRAGLSGRMTRQPDGSLRMSVVTSVCLRIARRINGASLPVRGHLFEADGRPGRVLLLGAPGCGKTTVLRDAAQYMARYVRVAVADEREELFAQPFLGEGSRIDVLGGVDKGRAFSMLIRSMSPQVIVCDELGREEDVQAMLEAARCGVGVLASAHADGLDDLLKRPVMRRLFEAEAFDRYIHLGTHGVVRAVWDGEGRRIEEKGCREHGELGDGGDGDDRREQHRISLVGRGKEARALDSGDAPVSFAAFRRHSL